MQLAKMSTVCGKHLLRVGLFWGSAGYAIGLVPALKRTVQTRGVYANQHIRHDG